MVIAEWKAGFIEDAENLHMALKSSIVSIISAWGARKEVIEKYIEFTPGGQKRLDKLMSKVEKKVFQVTSNYNKA
jgi:hypothetical protein